MVDLVHHGPSHTEQETWNYLCEEKFVHWERAESPHQHRASMLGGAGASMGINCQPSF